MNFKKGDRVAMNKEYWMGRFRRVKSSKLERYGTVTSVNAFEVTVHWDGLAPSTLDRLTPEYLLPADTGVDFAI